MTFKKTEIFDSDLQQLAEFAKIFSHPARLAILKYLAAQKNCISGDISNEIPLSRTTVSQHLQELKKSGLIQGTIDGVKICYCIDNGGFRKCLDLYEKFFKDTGYSIKIKCCK